jgi:fructokinase
MMRNVFCIGETVYDIIFKAGKPVSAKSGGSMLNSAISMGRMKLNPYFISEYGTDEIGNEIEKFLAANHVNTRNVFRYNEGKTSIAIAILNEKNDASYSFYKHLPDKRLNIDFPKIEKHDIVLFGSFYAINREIREQLKSFVKSAQRAGAIVIYDPNFRKAHLHELSDLLPLIIENMEMASIVRGSNEDFQMIFGAGTIEEAYTHVSKFCPNLLYTANSEGVHLKTPDINLKVPVAKLTPVSTIGAGDNFNAGLIYGFIKENISAKQTIVNAGWQKLIQYGIDFASEVCMSYENYISEEFAKEYTQK